MTLSLYVGPRSAHWLPLSLTDSLTAVLIVDLTGVTLAFEDANSKLLGVVSVADVDAEERVDNNLVEILKQRFGRDFETELWSNFLYDLKQLLW